jgi:hypothetical protein
MQQIKTKSKETVTVTDSSVVGDAILGLSDDRDRFAVVRLSAAEAWILGNRLLKIAGQVIR